MSDWYAEFKLCHEHGAKWLGFDVNSCPECLCAQLEAAQNSCPGCLCAQLEAAQKALEGLIELLTAASPGLGAGPATEYARAALARIEECLK